MEINEILSFLRVVRSAGFQQASRQYGTPKSTLSRQVQTLEARLGVTLLHRTTRKISLTSAGESLYQRTSSILEQIEEAEIELKSEMLGVSGKIRVTAPVDMGPSLLAKPLSRFLQLYPNINLELLLTDRIVDLVAEKIDIALRAGDLKNSQLKFKKIVTDSMVLVASPQFVAKIDPIKTPHEVAELSCVVFSPDLAVRPWVLVNGKEEVQIDPKLRQVVSSFAMCLEMVREGVGIAMVPKFMIQDDLLMGEMLVVLPQWQSTPRSMNLVWSHQQNMPKRIRILIDYLAEELRAK